MHADSEPLMSGEPPHLAIIDAVACSDVGRVRARNEDRLCIGPQRRWAIIADGMGGYQGGDIAAAIAVEFAGRVIERAWHDSWKVEQASIALLEATREANLAVYQAGVDDPKLANMGTTLLAVTVSGDMLLSAHVGDSRLYRLRNGELSCLTRDHTVWQQMIDEGMSDDSALAHAGARGVLTRALGVLETVEPDLNRHSLMPGDLFLMCTDGLTDMLHEEEMAGLLGAKSLELAARSLIAEANAHGGRDNISLVLLQTG